MEKIKAIIKRPDETHGHMTWISNTLENLQRTVGGFIEVVPLTVNSVMILNEEGKIKNLDGTSGSERPSRTRSEARSSSAEWTGNNSRTFPLTSKRGSSS